MEIHYCICKYSDGWKLHSLEKQADLHQFNHLCKDSILHCSEGRRQEKKDQRPSLNPGPTLFRGASATSYRSKLQILCLPPPYIPVRFSHLIKAPIRSQNILNHWSSNLLWESNSNLPSCHYCHFSCRHFLSTSFFFFCQRPLLAAKCRSASRRSKSWTWMLKLSALSLTVRLRWRWPPQLRCEWSS